MSRISPVTRQDVAKLAGVSPRTVSNVLNGFEHVSAETRERVQAAVDQLGYRANAAARTLRTGRTRVLALVVPALDLPYFAELARAVIREAGAAGYTVVIDQTDGDPDRERALLRGGPLGGMFDGVILSPLALTGEDLALARADDLPVVLLGEREIRGGFDHVLIDNVAAARLATEHLIAAGRRRIGAIGLQYPDEGGTSSQREEGFRAALASAGLTAVPEHLRSVERVERDSGFDEMLALLDSDPMPDAVFCFTDILAVGALRACITRGVRVPGDIAIIGFDDVEEARFTTPPLTTIRPDRDAIARHAVSRLIARLDAKQAGRTIDAEDLTVTHRLVKRESTPNPRSHLPHTLDEN